MKRILLICWMGVVAGAAEEVNPFVSHRRAEKEPVIEANAPACEFTLEHILVDPEVLREWESQGGGSDDELHAAVEQWVAGGRAVLDHTAWVTGPMGVWLNSEQTLEQIYATEVIPGGKGAWPYPTSFETRNLGYSFISRVTPEGEKRKTEWGIDLCQMVTPGRPYHPLVARTQHPGDLFLPQFRQLRASAGGVPAEDDPFTPQVEEPRHQALVFEEGKRYLWGRFETGEDSARTRLVFARSLMRDAVSGVSDESERPRRISLRVVRVDHGELWSLLKAPGAWIQDSAWSAFANVPQEMVADLMGWLPREDKLGIEAVQECTYPTEWVPGMKWEVTERWEELSKRGGKEGVASRATQRVVEPAVGEMMAATPTSFETRNVGFYLNLEVKGEMYDLEVDRVVKLGDSVHHRVQDGEEWIADVTMPVFGHSRVETLLPAVSCDWKLIGVGGEFLLGGEPDQEHRLLYFLKLE
ncbi:hypothetical protein HNR46_002387 [Haloferula luteola]|uniref:Uncharacterized protein n=1 Tax=Haloferula luteola TaxID=595692 RepID=A0A840V536_9BACT|nr:hypothetical protein [Haloferula luteola]MBB5352146.1 hypothetical protein [Haloferula luteola]